MAVGFFLCLGYLTAGVGIFDFRFCGRANVVVTAGKFTPFFSSRVRVRVRTE